MKSVLISCCLLAFIFIGNAQNTSPYWSLAGNTNASTTSKIGTVNSIPLRVVTKNLERIRIDTLGRVGIGTITPSQVLHVVGNGYITGNLGLGVTPTQKLHVKGNGIFTGNVGIGTTSTAYKLYLKGTANASQLVIDAYTTQSNTQPLIRLRDAAGADLLTIHSDHVTNLFIGVNAGRVNSNVDGKYNAFVGNNAGYSNTSGSLNAAFGFNALYANTSGYDNTALGASALEMNTSGAANTATGEAALAANTQGNYNVALGSGSLRANITGSRNTATGHGALSRNNGNDNTAFGYTALANNIPGYANTAVGGFALINTQNASFNTAVGYFAGNNRNNGYNNVFVGANTDVIGDGFYNVIAIGQGTICTAPSQVTMGNSATTSYRAYNYWSNISDGRYKKNIKDNVPGLAFINKLKPVTYNLDATGLDNFLNKGRTTATQMSGEGKAIMAKALQDKEQILQTGFIAQDVEKAAKEIGYDFSGVDAAKNENDVYGLRYAEFVVPLVKAVQELSKKQEEIDDLKNEINELRQMVMELKNQKTNVPLVNSGDSYLKQNVPNPSNGTTIIGYFISNANRAGEIRITDAKGSTLKTYTASPGQGQLKINNSDLPAGTYFYSLYVNNLKADTKQMIITR